jgi:hypothetical protein
MTVCQTRAISYLVPLLDRKRSLVTTAIRFRFRPKAADLTSRLFRAQQQTFTPSGEQEQTTHANAFRDSDEAKMMSLYWA